MRFQFRTLPLITLGFFWSQASQAAGVVTAEKNCNVRVEGGNYREGDKLLLYRDAGLKKQRLAIVEITKKSGEGKAIGRVLNPPRSCASLRGALSEVLAAGSKAGGSGGNVPKAEVNVGMNFTFLNQKGLLIGKPGEQFASNPNQLKAIGGEIQADVYPLAFYGDGWLHRSLGLGFSFGFGSVVPKSDVPPKDNPAGAKVGTLSTSLQALQVDLIFRVFYIDNRMSTELRPVIYISRKVSHTYAGDAGGTDALPITNMSSSGMGIALRQRFLITPTLRVNAGFLFPFALKGTVSYVSGAGSDGLANASGYYLDASADYFLNFFKLWTGISYGSFGGSVTALNESRGAEETYKLEDARFLMSLGSGVYF